MKVIKASGNEVEPYWPMLFAKALKSANVDDLLTNIAAAAPAGGQPAREHTLKQDQKATVSQ